MLIATNTWQNMVSISAIISKKYFPNFTKMLIIWLEKSGVDNNFFIYGYSIILSTATKYYPYFTQLAWMIYTMMRDKPSFALLNLLE